jgi:hypothetical protein
VQGDIWQGRGVRGDEIRPARFAANSDDLDGACPAAAASRAARI